MHGRAAPGRDVHVPLPGGARPRGRRRGGALPRVSRHPTPVLLFRSMRDGRHGMRARGVGAAGPRVLGLRVRGHRRGVGEACPAVPFAGYPTTAPGVCALPTCGIDRDACRVRSLPRATVRRLPVEGAGALISAAVRDRSRRARGVRISNDLCPAVPFVGYPTIIPPSSCSLATCGVDPTACSICRGSRQRHGRTSSSPSSWKKAFGSSGGRRISGGSWTTGRCRRCRRAPSCAPLRRCGGAAVRHFFPVSSSACAAQKTVLNLRRFRSLGCDS